MKYADPALAARLSGAPDYVERAREAIVEMVRQRGRFLMDKKGLLRKGVLIRHLVLPGQLDNTRRVIDWIAQTFPPRTVLVSLMGQYTPMGGDDLPTGSTLPTGSILPDSLRRPLTEEEYALAADYLEQAGLEHGYLQPPEAAGKEYIPEFEP